VSGNFPRINKIDRILLKTRKIPSFLEAYPENPRLRVLDPEQCEDW
jgi:hypothetical protein